MELALKRAIASPASQPRPKLNPTRQKCKCSISVEVFHSVSRRDLEKIRFPTFCILCFLYVFSSIFMFFSLPSISPCLLLLLRIFIKACCQDCLKASSNYEPSKGKGGMKGKSDREKLKRWLWSKGRWIRMRVVAWQREVERDREGRDQRD